MRPYITTSVCALTSGLKAYLVARRERKKARRHSLRRALGERHELAPRGAAAASRLRRREAYLDYRRHACERGGEGEAREDLQVGILVPGRQVF